MVAWRPAQGGPVGLGRTEVLLREQQEEDVEVGAEGDELGVSQGKVDPGVAAGQSQLVANLENLIYQILKGLNLGYALNH